METQDHKKPKQPGHEGHSGGVHFCKRCGWPFPNPHPSAKHRRAHKKVCGTVEGYRLDNDAQNKSHLMDGSDSEHVSDNERKSPSVKVVERTISTRSSSGVGSRSSRSTRSEDDVFTDAVTDFTDSTGPVEASDGVIQRFYSIQCVTENDLDDVKDTAENAGADNLCSTNVLLKDSQDQGQAVQKLESDIDKVEAGFISQDHNSCSTSGPALIPTSVTVGPDNKVDASDEGKEVVSSNELELRSTFKDTAQEASEDVSGLKTVDEAIPSPPFSGEVVKSIVMDSTGSKNNSERSEGADTPVILHPLDHMTGAIDPTIGSMSKSSDVMEDHGSNDSKNNSERSEGADASVNLHPLDLMAGAIDPANGSMSKSSDVMEDHGSQTGAYEDVYVLAVPDNLPLCQCTEIAIEELDHKGGKINTVKATYSVTETGDNKIDSTQAAEEAIAGIDLKSGDSKKVSSEEDVLESAVVVENELKQDVEQKAIVEESIVGELGQKSDIIEASDTDINKLKIEVFEDIKSENLEDENISFAREEKPVVSLESVFPEGASTDATNNLDINNGTADTCNNVKNNTEHVILQEIEESEGPRKELSGSLSLAEHAVSGVPTQVTEPTNIHDTNDTDNDENMRVVQTHLDGNEMNRGGGNEAVTAESAPGCNSSTVGSRDGIHEPLESEKTCDHDNSDKRMGSGDVVVGLSPPVVDSTVGSSAGAQCTGEEGTGPKSDNIPGSISKMIPSDSLEACEDAQQQLQSSAFGKDIRTKKFAEEAPGAVEGDRTIKQHVAISACDVLPDSSSLTDSLEGNWGSVSVMSTISDTPPATPLAEENAGLELKPVMESENCGTKKAGEPQFGIETKEGASEIETLEEHQQKGSAWSSSVAHADNAPHGGKRNEEVSEVTNGSADKHHTPLKTLLGEATARSRAESPIHNQMKPQTDEIPLANNGFPKTENVVLSSTVTTSEASKEEMGKEWNSPARYPVNIKTEKRKPKGRPYWAPFLCCSSVNAR